MIGDLRRVPAALNLAYALAERPAPAPADRAAVDGDGVQALVARIDAALGADGRLL